MKKRKLLFIPLTSDYMFKLVFMGCPDILKRLLISVLHLDMNPNEAVLSFLNTELPKSRKGEYRKTVDILVSIDERKIIDVEINSERYSYIKERNAFYIEKIISIGVESGTSYEGMKEYYFYQLNLNIGNGNYFEDKYFTFIDTKTNETLTQNLKIIYKSLIITEIFITIIKTKIILYYGLI